VNRYGPSVTPKNSTDAGIVTTSAPMGQFRFISRRVAKPSGADINSIKSFGQFYLLCTQFIL